MTSPVLERPNEKQTRYDRGMRLWGQEGQTALETAHVCLLNATAAGSELLKNLVLSGVGKITIVDGEMVTARDFGRNFFVDCNHHGKSRAATVAELLLEMNPKNVRAESVEHTPADLLADRPDFFTSAGVHCVVAADLPDKLLLQVEDRCREAGCALVVLRCNGMIGYLRLQAGEHCVIEGFPDSQVPDLRILNAFPQLLDFFESFDPDSINDTHIHAHIPWVVLAHHYTKRWREKTGKALPTSYADRKEIKQLILDGRKMKTVEEQTEEERKAGLPPGYREEENYDEAVSNLNKYLPLDLDPALKKIFDDPSCVTPTRDGNIFWVLVNSLRAFHQEFGVLPLSGSIPDMTSTTADYVALKKVHQDEAARNRQWIHEKAISTLQSLGRDPSELSEALVTKFCKNARNLRAIRFKSLADELSAPNNDLPGVLASAGNNVWWYVLMRAAETFRATKGKYPGETEQIQCNLDDDVAEMEQLVKALLVENKCKADSVPLEYIKEWTRSGHSEIHTVAAVLGGVGSQEVIKLVTRQRVPLNNTLIFNGIHNTMGVFAV